MKKPKPTNQESYFGIDELFFSKTNLKGVIESSNGVFIRVSKYEKGVMIGAPHSIVRHPDMPRCVFKLFWDTIKADKPIAAYVKNLSADGSYYWVLAAVFPVEGGYLSIRLKPTTEIFSLVQGLYKKLLKCEQENDMAAGGALLNELLQEAQFRDYSEFMTRALIQELTSRSEQLQKESFRQDHSTQVAGEDDLIEKDFQKIVGTCKNISSGYLSVFERLENFSNASQQIRQNTMKVLGSYNELGKLSINMAAAAERAGSKGLTLTVVAGYFQTLAEQIQKQLNLLRSSIEALSETIEDCEFSIASARLQGDMVQFFIEECRKLDDTKDLNASLVSCTELIDLAFGYSSRVKETLQTLVGQLRRFKVESRELENLVLGLEVVRQSGNVEASRSFELKGAFDAHIQKMQQFIEQVKKPTSEINDYLEELIEDSRESVTLVLDAITNFTEVSLVKDRLVKNLNVAA